jgi:hypothetical protein
MSTEAACIVGEYGTEQIRSRVEWLKEALEGHAVCISQVLHVLRVAGPV